ncbi:unnamed protein product, partial [marine sediment metagenome]
WMALELNLVPEMAIVQPWQPIVRVGAESNEIAKALIQHSQEYVSTHSPSRLETWIPLIKKGLDQTYETYASWYESAGFEKIAEEYRMQIDLATWTLNTSQLNANIEILLLDQVSNEELQGVVFDTFLQSDDQWFLKQNQTHQEGAISLWLNRGEAFDKESSLVFKKNGKYVGFIVARVENDVPDLGPIGVHPDFREQNLGTALVTLSLDKLKTKGYETAILEVSTENTPAVNLYEKLGFEKQYRIFLYGWSPE